MPTEHAADLRVADTRTLRGPNVWHLTPVIEVELRAGHLADSAPRDFEPALERLYAALPALPRSAGDSWGQLVVGVTMELQRLAGSPSSFGRVLREDPAEDRRTLAIGYDDEDLGHDALRSAARVIRDCLRGDDPQIGETVSELARAYERAMPDEATTALLDEARRRGIAVRRDPDDGVIQLGLGATQRRLPHPDGVTIDALYGPDDATTIPLIAVTGTNGKTTTTRLIAHLFAQAGFVVGYTTTDGVYVDDALVMQGDLTGPFAANLILSHPDVEVAVLETARGGILRAGLGWDQCDVGVVTNVTSDHLGLKGIDTIEQLADVKAVIPAVVKDTGYAVLNADDPLVFAMRERTAGRIVLFSTVPVGESAHVEEHLARGGIVARVERTTQGEELVIREGEKHVALALVVDVPLTFGGLARFQLGNVLAAAAAAYVQGLSESEIHGGLLSFVPSAGRTPGRLNVIETTRGRVMIDYAHNAAAVEGLVDFLAATPATRRIALLSAPGDRRDEDLREIGRLAARLDIVIPKEHEVYRRGRERGAINALITEGLIEAGFPASRIVSFVEEHDAVAYLMELMQPGDVAVIVADDTAAVTAQIAPYVLSG
ncbi:MAG: Mur ligase family protein [Gemmatimonadaceae bacterium]